MNISNTEKDTIESLTSSFALTEADNNLVFKNGEGDITVIEIKNRHASATISLQGAQLLSWIPVAEEEVIWLSDHARFAVGKSVRGGIPVCWPWFGAHESNADFPAHGFARTTLWQVVSTQALAGGSTRITFTMLPGPDNAAMWPSDSRVQFQLTIGKKLELELVTHNDGSQPITITQALHTYFNVADVSELELHGLEDTDYLDKVENFQRKHQKGAITIAQEVDRIYLDTASDCVIEDKILKRNIKIAKTSSHTTVVWNPWQESAEKMGDLGEQGYKRMLCVESANVADDAVVIPPGKTHTLWVQYEVQGI
jgi:glucose-6-phosphate 1-epimerase